LFSIDCSNNGSKPKGGGLSSTIGGSQMLGGVQKQLTFLDKSTWTLRTNRINIIIKFKFHGNIK
jgi:preprotein translocase subunit SecG